MSLDSTALARRIAELALEKKAERVVILDMRELYPASDYFVIGSATTDVQVKAIADHVIEELGKESVRPWHVEGVANRRWVLLDFVDVVAHVFLEEARNFYLLEKLWADAPLEEVEDPAASLPRPDHYR